MTGSVHRLDDSVKTKVVRLKKKKNQKYNETLDLQEAYLKKKGRKAKEWKTTFQVHSNQKKAGITLAMAGKIEIKVKGIKLRWGSAAHNGNTFSSPDGENLGVGYRRRHDAGRNSQKQKDRWMPEFTVLWGVSMVFRITGRTCGKCRRLWTIRRAWTTNCIAHRHTQNVSALSV